MSILDHTPQMSTAQAAKYAQEIFGIQADPKALPSERDQNFLLTTQSGEKFVLKIANATEDIVLLEAQNQAMTLLHNQGVTCPQVIHSLNGKEIEKILFESQETHFVRLVSYLEGMPYGHVRRQSGALFLNLGAYLGSVDRALMGFDHPAVQRDFHWDLARAPEIVAQYRPLITDPTLEMQVDQLCQIYEQSTQPHLSQLRRSVIHNDANNFNVIVSDGDDFYSRNQQVVGLIDFGDIVHSYTIGELAVAIAYAILEKDDPLAVVAELVKGYHQEFPLTEAEIAALFGLVGMRVSASICLAAHQLSQRPGDEYLNISQEPIRKTLPIWLKIHPRFAEAAFRQACGLEPLPQSDQVVEWLMSERQNIKPIVDADLHNDPLAFIDLGISSPLLGLDKPSTTEATQTARIFEQMNNTGARIGIGLYDEARVLYLDPSFENRTVHLGIDLYAQPGTPVYAPLPGKVFDLHNNAAPKDYGPVIILEHQTDDGVPFFTLYGHLSLSSLEGLEPGQGIETGGKIGEIGSAEVNGGWTPHLHIQIIVDVLDMDHDFPGICRADQRELWEAYAPDPNLLLGIPAERFPDRSPDKAQTLRLRRQLLGGNLSLGYREPLKIERGWMQYLFDDVGRRYIDAYNNVPHVGHCHPRVVAAAREQLGVLNTNTRYLHDHILQYARRITATLPEPLSVCYVVNSGSEANELALRLARAYTGVKDMLVMEASYHGNTTSLIDISPYKHAGPGGQGAPDWVHTIPIPDTYRGLYKADDPLAGSKYSAHVQEAIEGLERSGSKLAGLIAETCPSVGGQIFLPQGYLSQVYDFVRAAGGLCIADEVQTGYGRIGTHFYAFEAHGVVPDIVVLGKPIGNGQPLGVVVTRPEIAAAFDNGMEFFSTFGGNTVSCAIGMTVLDVVLEENLQEHARQVGDHLLEGLRRFEEQYALVGDVRGSGLFLGVELVLSPESREPAAQEATFMANRMAELGVLLGTDGPDHNVIKIRPPMPFDKQNADTLLSAMEQILWEDFA